MESEYLSDDGLETPEVGAWAEEKYRIVNLYDTLFSTGMKNIQERISLLSKINKGNIQMRVIDLVDKYDNGTGTEVELMLPANI